MPAVVGGHFRASDADREHVIGTLEAAFVQGRLTRDELDVRVGQALASRTYMELAAVTAGIPAGRARARARAPLPTSKKAAGWSLGVGASIPAALIAVAILTGNENLGKAAFGPMVGFVLIGIAWAMIAVGIMADARVKNARSLGQLPPGPGPRGPALDDHGIGRQLGRPEVRRDETGAELRARGSRRDRDPKTPRVIPVARKALAGLG